jgi:hypothetical protein
MRQASCNRGTFNIATLNDDQIEVLLVLLIKCRFALEIPTSRKVLKLFRMDHFFFFVYRHRPPWTQRVSLCVHGSHIYIYMFRAYNY